MPSADSLSAVRILGMSPNDHRVKRSWSKFAMTTRPTQRPWTYVLALTLGSLGAVAAAQQPGQQDEVALLKALSSSSVTLADGIQQAAKSDGVPISAKFEFDSHGKLSLSVHTAGKGLSVAPAQNVLKALSGSPEQAGWTPMVEVFKDDEHVTRASEQLRLLSGSLYSLADLVKKAQGRAPGSAFSVAPGVLRRVPIALVELAVQDRIVRLVYDLKSGELLGGTPPYGNVPGRRDAPFWEDKRGDGFIEREYQVARTGTRDRFGPAPCNGCRSHAGNRHGRQSALDLWGDIQVRANSG